MLGISARPLGGPEMTGLLLQCVELDLAGQLLILRSAMVEKLISLKSFEICLIVV